MKYLYDGHMGHLYVTEKERTFDQLYCQVCGDSDRLIGTFDTLSDYWNIIKDSCDINGSGGWSLQYIFPLMAKEFDVKFNITYECYADEVEGFCSNTDADIIKQIEQHI